MDGRLPERFVEMSPTFAMPSSISSIVALGSWPMDIGISRTEGFLLMDLGTSYLRSCSQTSSHSKSIVLGSDEFDYFCFLRKLSTSLTLA
ncbi:hypothetical protein Nepgr_015725 [Nepenthes gracilis]|uniref:Uncharacterized protein n=1 Tax=Nepenthes gracilis TaxID=150966 RepID=A0AAD3SNH2_NEPGR|nr:hypothetical protein Nepgr_015725 [Nepenthes gracilis]